MKANVIFRGLCLLGQLFLVSVLRAEPYFNVYTGIVEVFEQCSYLQTKNTYGIEGLNGYFQAYPTTGGDASMPIGCKLGYWSRHHPHLGFFLDCNYHTLKYCHSMCLGGAGYAGSVQNSLLSTQYGCARTTIRQKGYALTLALPLACRWGTHADEGVPFGRVQLYVAAGPGLFLTKLCSRLVVDPHNTDGSNFAVKLLRPYHFVPCKKKVKAGACLVVDAGLDWVFSRYFGVRNQYFSFNLFARYQYAPGSFRFNQSCVGYKPKYHMLSGNFGIAFHF